MKKIIALVMFSLWSLFNSGVYAEEAKDAHKPHQHRHPEHTKIKNPLAMSEQSIAEGRKFFEKHCMACHGKAGTGGIGSDLTSVARKHGSSDGEVFHVISDGVQGTAMRGFGNELSEKMRWHVVNYLNSLKKSEKNKMGQ